MSSARAGDGAASPRVLAHRGARTVAPENTLEAFKIAIEQGADGVELDVHRTADGALVVHHDADAPGLGVLADLPLAAIRAARPEIPTLAEVLDLCAGTLVNVEIKNLPGDSDYDATDQAADLVVALLTARGDADDVLVSSFNLDTIGRVRELDGSVRTGFLTMTGIDPYAAISWCIDRGHAAIHPFHGMLPEETVASVVVAAHEHALLVNTWTVNDEYEIERLASAGVDAVITDVPDLARRVIDERRGPPR